jgi:opacity protein-like surface antigen
MAQGGGRNRIFLQQALTNRRKGPKKASILAVYVDVRGVGGRSMLRMHFLAGLSAVALASVIAATPVTAADIAVEPEPVVESNWYLSLHGGWKFDEEWDDDLDATHGVDPNDTAKLSIETEDGWRVGGALGYMFNSWLAVEGEIGYMTQDFKSAEFVEANPAGEFGGLEGDKFDLDGDTSILTGMVNAIVGFPIGSILRPYIGAGVGAGHVNADASITQAPINDFHLDDSDTVFAAQAFAGVDVAVSQNIGIGGRVRYLHLSDFDLVDDEDHKHSVDPDGIISAELVLTFLFGGP